MEKVVTDNTDKYLPLVIYSFSKDKKLVFDYHGGREHGRFFIPIHMWPELESRVLNEDWNLRDVREDDGVFRTYVEANFKVTDPIIKIMYSNNKWKWITAEDWQTDPKYKDCYISEIKLKPYYYTDDYGQTKIAGQLKFMELNIDEPLYEFASLKKEDKLSKILDEMESKIEPTVDVVEPKEIVAEEHKAVNIDTSNDAQLVNVVAALGYTPKQAIKILLEVI